MNDMPPDELASFKADVKVAFIGAGIALIVLIMWLRSDPDPTFINEPCAPAHPVYVNGEKVGCTNDKPTSQPDYVRGEDRG